MAGEVIIAGAGPGNPLFISYQLLLEMKKADVIVHDRLIHREILRFANPDADIIFAGKEAKHHYLKQYEINDLLVSKAKEGKRVLRIQGGDPIIFGRTGEELEKLAEAGIPFRLIPGITAGVAAPEFAGIPLTHRKVTSMVMFVTGHEDPGKNYPSVDWESVARFGGTVVIFMGVGNLRNNMERLIKLGKSPEAPVAIIENGAYYNQKVITGKIRNIADLAEKEGIKPPAITVIGDVVKYREQNVWFEKLPLYGRKIAIMRSEEDMMNLGIRVWNEGGEVVFFPVIRFEPLDFIDEVKEKICFKEDNSHYLVFTSPRGVKFFFSILNENSLDVRCIGMKKVAAIGPSTIEELKKYGIISDLVPPQFVAESLAEALLKEKPAKVTILRAKVARDALPQILRENEVETEIISLYQTIKVTHKQNEVDEVKNSDYFLFTSSSTFKNFAEHFSSLDFLRKKVISIGPVTSSTIKEYGIEPLVEADEHTIEGVYRTLISYVKKEKGG